MKAAAQFRLGIKSFFEGIRILRSENDLKTLSLVPVFMSLLLYTVGLIVGVMYLDDVLSFVIKQNINDYNVFLKSLAYILSFVTLVFVLYFGVLVVVSLLSIPICDAITYKIMVRRGYLKPAKTNLVQAASTFLKMLRASLAKLILILIVSLILIIASFAPFLSPVAIYLSLLMLAFDCLEYALENDEKGFKERFYFLRKNWIAMSGLAACMAVVLVIPLIHFILLPAAVAGATVLYVEIQGKSEKEKV